MQRKRNRDSSIQLSRIVMVCVCLVAQSFWFFATLWTVAHQAPLSMRILQERILEWVAIPSSRGSSWPRDWTQVSHIEIKRHLLLGRKVMINLDSILKSRDITLSTNIRLVKAMVFPMIMYGCESWTLKKAEHRRTDVFELWCWRRILRVPWTERRSIQFILKEICPRCSLEGLMLKLKLQYFGRLMWRTDSLEKTLMLGKIKGGRRTGDRGWDDWMAPPTQT